MKFIYNVQIEIIFNLLGRIYISNEGLGNKQDKSYAYGFTCWYSNRDIKLFKLLLLEMFFMLI
jgi:hypothetical protein